MVYRLSVSMSGLHSLKSLRTVLGEWHQRCFLSKQEVMETRTGFFQLVSAVVGLSVGLGVMTATVLLGVAALLQ
jgi:hypothetical protein